MSNSIGIKVKKAPEGYDLGASKFFGTPTIPLEWQEDFYDDEIFFCQIRLADLAGLDRKKRWPSTGYLYVFIHTADGAYDLRADVRYYDGEPQLALDDFNGVVADYEKFTEAYLMEFYEADEGADCTRLFGLPSDWNYEDEPPALLMQYDPLDSDMGFLDHLDGFIYFVFGENERDFSAVSILEMYS